MYALSDPQPVEDLCTHPPTLNQWKTCAPKRCPSACTSRSHLVSQYVCNKLKTGESYDLLVFKDLIMAMAGMEANDGTE